ncbi:MAG: phage holin family protein [Chitinophagaceae bacterium]
MEETKSHSQNLKTHLGEYVNNYVQLTKVKATQGISTATSGAVIGIAAFLFGMFFLSFLFTGIAYWLASVFNSTAAGFFAVAGFFLLLLILIFALRKKVIVPFIRNSIISKVYGQ